MGLCVSVRLTEEKFKLISDYPMNILPYKNLNNGNSGLQQIIAWYVIIEVKKLFFFENWNISFCKQTFAPSYGTIIRHRKWSKHEFHGKV